MFDGKKQPCTRANISIVPNGFDTFTHALYDCIHKSVLPWQCLTTILSSNVLSVIITSYAYACKWNFMWARIFVQHIRLDAMKWESILAKKEKPEQAILGRKMQKTVKWTRWKAEIVLRFSITCVWMGFRVYFLIFLFTLECNII